MIKQISFIAAIQSLGFDGVCSFSDIPTSQADVDAMFSKQVGTGEFDTAIMEVGNCPFTYDELEAERQRLQDIENAKAYQYNRAAEYPSVNDYLDGIVKGDQAQIDAYIAACQAVKAKYPKPE